MPPAQDHKRLQAGDRGPNTGGMGAVAPAAGPLSSDQLSGLAQRVFQPLVDHWTAEDITYCGETGGGRVREFRPKQGYENEYPSPNKLRSTCIDMPHYDAG